VLLVFLIFYALECDECLRLIQLDCFLRSLYAYCNVLYSKRKIEDFLNTLEGFRMTVDIVTKLEQSAQNFRLIFLHVFYYGRILMHM